MHFWYVVVREQISLRPVRPPSHLRASHVTTVRRVCHGPRFPGCRGGCLSFTGMSLGLCSTLSYPLCISKPVQAIRTSSTPLLWTTRSHKHVDHRASSKLFADAEHEHSEGTGVVTATQTRTGIHRGTTSEHPNWTGDESIEDAVLRMLVDKYKPLRTGTIRSAEEKMHRAPPQILVCNSQK
jgi:hypothetical protein